MKKTSLFAFLAASIFVCFFLFFCLSGSRPYLTVIGPIKMADGIGRQSVELMDVLFEAVSINCIPISKPNFKDVPERVKNLIEKGSKRLGKVVIYEASLPSPGADFFKRLNKRLRGPKNEQQIRIAYSMLESSLIPPQWAEGLNKYFDAVVVPDGCLVSVYKNSGVEIPIFTLPLGLNIDPFLKRPLKKERHHPFCFINASSMIPRKNHEGLIQAFYKAFGDNPDVVLRMNYRGTVGGALENAISLIASLKAHNIYLTDTPLDAEAYMNFLSEGDVFVTLAKGEGFSIQPREAMALGLPVILSDNTAHHTIVASGLACAVPCPSSSPAYNPYLKCLCGVEYIADIDAAAEVLRAVYEHYEAYLDSAAERREWAAKYQFENFRSLYLNLIKPTKIILGEMDAITPEALITSSPELFNKYQTLFSKQ
jgi:glycosyltransferase involved in cell wall biosynthesis